MPYSSLVRERGKPRLPTFYTTMQLNSCLTLKAAEESDITFGPTWHDCRFATAPGKFSFNITWTSRIVKVLLISTCRTLTVLIRRFLVHARGGPMTFLRRDRGCVALCDLGPILMLV